MNTGNCRTAYFSDRQPIGHSLLVVPSITQKHLTQQHTSKIVRIYRKFETWQTIVLTIEKCSQPSLLYSPTTVGVA